MWPRSRTSIRARSNKLHQRPDRWQHPTTHQPHKTACTLRGVHRWKADVAPRKSYRLLSAKCGAQALGHTVELLPRHGILCCARRVWDDVKVDVADVLAARIILLDREAGRTKSTLLSGTDLPGDKESMTHLGWYHVEQAPHGPLRDDERMPRMIPLQRQQHDHLSIFVNPRCRQLTSKDAGERVVLLIRLVERTAQSWRGRSLRRRWDWLRGSDCCQSSHQEGLHSHDLSPLRSSPHSHEPRTSAMGRKQTFATSAARTLARGGAFPHMRRGSRADEVVANPVRSGRKQP